MTTTQTHIDVLPFLVATEAAVLTPHRLTDYLNRLDDTTLEAMRAFGVYVARGAAAVQGIRRFEQMWQDAATPAPIGPEEAAEFVAVLADLPTADPVPPGRHAAEPPAAQDDTVPAAVPAATNGREWPQDQNESETA